MMAIFRFQRIRHLGQQLLLVILGVIGLWIISSVSVADAEEPQSSHHTKELWFHKFVQKENKDKAQSELRWGLIYYNERKYEAAMGRWTKAIECHPTVYAYNNRGLAFYQLGRFDEAISDLANAIELDANFADAYRNRGAAFYYKGEYDRCIADTSRAIKLAPGDARLYSNRAAAYAMKGEWNRAIIEYTTAIELDSGHFVAYKNRAVARIMLEQVHAAIEDYTQAITLRPDYSDAYYLRAFAYASRGESDLAISDLRRVVQFEGASDLGARALEFLNQLGGVP